MNQVEIKRRQMEICSRMLGLITLLILGGVVGDNGVAYIAAAMECFLLFWTLTGGAASDILGRMLRGRIARGQYRNAAKMRRTALYIESAAGAACSVLMLLFAGPIAQNVFKISYSAPLVMILAPAVFLRTVSSVLLGYFQGEGAELPTVISAVMRQLSILIFGLVFSRIFQGYGSKVSVLLKQDNFTAMYGGMGIALAVSVTECIVLLFLFLVYRGSRSDSGRKNEGMRITDNFGSQARFLCGNLFPAAFAGLMQILPLILGLILYRKAVDTAADVERYGLFYGKYLALCGIVILPIYALLLGSSSKGAANMRREEQRIARNHFWGGFHIGVVHSLFWVMVCVILAPQIAGTFGNGRAEELERMLRSGALLILFVVLGRFFSEFLRQMRGKYLVLGILAVYDIIFTVCATIMLNAGNQGIMALVYAGLISEGIFAAAAGALVCWQIRCGIDWLQGLAIPAGAACVSGLVILFLGKAITPHLGNPAAVAICVILAAGIYWVILFLMRNFRGEDTGYLPGGNLIRAVKRLLRIH